MNVLLHMCCGPCAVAVIEWLLEKGHTVTGFFFNPNIHPLMEYLRRREAAVETAAYYGIPLILTDTLPLEEQHWRGCDLVGHDAGRGATRATDASSDEGGHSLAWQDPLTAYNTPLEEAHRHQSTEETVAHSALAFAQLPPAVNPVLWLRMIHGHEQARCSLCWASRLEKTADYAAQKGFEAITSSLLYSRYQNHALLKEQAETFAGRHGLTAVYADFREMWQYGIDRSKELGLYRQPYCGCVLSEYERYSKKLQKLLG